MTYDAAGNNLTVNNEKEPGKNFVSTYSDNKIWCLIYKYRV